MKAIVQDRFGSADVLELRDVPDPVVGDGDVLVRVQAAGCGPGRVAPDGGQAVPGSYEPRRYKGLKAPPRVGRRGGVSRRRHQRQENWRPGDEVMGFVKGSFAELATGTAGQARAQAGQHLVRAGLGRSGVGLHRAPSDRDHAGTCNRVSRCSSSERPGGVGTLTVQIAKAFGARGHRRVQRGRRRIWSVRWVPTT